MSPAVTMNRSWQLPLAPYEAPDSLLLIMIPDHVVIDVIVGYHSPLLIIVDYPFSSVIVSSH